MNGVANFIQGVSSDSEILVEGESFTMHGMKLRVSRRALAYSAAVFGLTVAVLFYGSGFNTAGASPAAVVSPSATFPANAATLGAIPDNDCDASGGRRVTFTVSGLTGAPSEVAVSMTFNPTHTWVGDVDVFLSAPGGTPSFEIFTFTNPGNTGFGDNSDLTGPYNFTDSATNGWWAAANATGAMSAIPAGDYRTASSTGANTNLTAAFAGVTNPNGTWTMRFNDCAEGDTGGVSAASLTINTGGGGGTNVQHVVDYDGDGKTDPSVVRNTGGGATGQVTWYHDLSSDNPTPFFQRDFGIATDDFVPEDYDGDGKTDIAVWRSGPPFGSFFYIFQSMTNTVRVENFGQIEDDPTVTADYTGDGKADPAVYRDGATPADKSFWFYRASSGPLAGQIVYTQWGQGGDFPSPGDYNGDGRADFNVQRNNGFGQAAFLRRNGTGGGDPGGNADSVVVFGPFNQFNRIVPGDYDGDGMTDIGILDLSGNNILWSIRYTATGAVFQQFWGLSANDFAVQGDYNSDGRTDLAVWRPNADATMNFFYPFSIPTGMLPPVEWGQLGDFPVANYNTH